MEKASIILTLFVPFLYFTICSFATNWINLPNEGLPMGFSWAAFSLQVSKSGTQSSRSPLGLHYVLFCGDVTSFRANVLGFGAASDLLVAVFEAFVCLFSSYFLFFSSLLLTFFLKQFYVSFSRRKEIEREHITGTPHCINYGYSVFLKPGSSSVM